MNDNLPLQRGCVAVVLEFSARANGEFMTDVAIRTEKLTRHFGNLVAVDAMDLQVTAGQFFGFLGPNGAGKSTTIKMLTGLLAPSSGRVEVLGLDFAAHPVDVKRHIGVVPEGMGLFDRLTGTDYLRFVGRMYGLDKQTTERRAEELLEFMQLADRPKTMIVDYSHGMQKKTCPRRFGDSRAACFVSGRAVRRGGRPCRGRVEVAPGPNDGARRDDFSDLPRYGNCGAFV